MFYNIIKNEALKQATILLYGVIGGFDWDEWRYINKGSSFVKDLKDLEASCDRIDVRVNSPGGDVWEGLPIINAIKQSKCEIHTYNDGIAYSMGSGILLAGHVVHAPEASLIMIHSASVFGYGNSAFYRETADTLDKYDEVLSTVVKSKVGDAVEDVIATYFDGKDHYITAKEALDLGLIDHLEGDIEKDPALSNVDLRNYKAVFTAFAPEGSIPPNKKIKPGKQNKIDMNLELLRARATKANGSIPLSSEEATAIIAEIDASRKVGNFLSDAELETLRTNAASGTELNTQLTAANDTNEAVIAALRNEGEEGEINAIDRITQLQTELAAANKKLDETPPGGSQGADPDDFGDPVSDGLSQQEKDILNEFKQG